MARSSTDAFPYLAILGVLGLGYWYTHKKPAASKTVTVTPAPPAPPPGSALPSAQPPSDPKWDDPATYVGVAGNVADGVLNPNAPSNNPYTHLGQTVTNLISKYS